MDNLYPYLFLDSAQCSQRHGFIEGFFSVYEYNLDKSHLRMAHYPNQPVAALKVSYFTHEEIERDPTLHSSYSKKHLAKSRHFTRNSIPMLHHILSKLSPEPSEANLQLAVDLGLFDTIGHVGS